MKLQNEAAKEELRQMKSEVNSTKHDLLRLADKIEAANPKAAEGLRSIIGRLEAWQHR